MAQGYFNEDTIAAIATSPHAQAAIGIVRLSGAKAQSIAVKLLRHTKTRQAVSLETIVSHKLQHCLLVDTSEQVLDDAMFVWMQEPNTFTGEDVVELHLHGNPLILHRVLDLLTKNGARLALPGEFSFRAFRSGKMDLSQAEAVMDTISSRTPHAVDNALQALLGSTRELVDRLKQRLLHLLAEVEVDIDFSDQGLSQIDFSDWSSRLEAWCADLEKIRQTFQKTSPLREGIRVAIVGAPNSGKSTLFNALLGEDRSIVSNIAGTTRDVVRESFQLGGLLFLLADTAGLRNAENSIEAEGIVRSFGEIRGAQMLFWVLDASDIEHHSLEYLQKAKVGFLRESPEAHILLCWNKRDLLPAAYDELNISAQALALPAVFISARLQAGMEDLEALALKEAKKLFSVDQESFHVGRLRHYTLLGEAAGAARGAIRKVRSGEAFPDLLSSDLRAALASLGEITGEVGIEDVLTHIFSEFCIGK